jgi:TRAP-type C4-dicarboxylate transport system permease large subunit
MSVTTIGIIGIVILVFMLFSKMPVGFVMGFLGFLGFAYVVNLDAALGLLARDFFEIFSSYGLTVVPLFVLMGQVAFHSGISRRLYDSAYVVLGKRRGGLAMATVAACAGFSAISGSTNATAATMATVTLPEMKRYKYDMGLATGTVAAAGSLGILIPPSTIFIVYGILTEQSIGKLFLAGIFPGILLSILFILTIYLRVLKNPSLAPPGLETSMREKIKSFAGVLETLLIFGMVMGGIFFGIFSPTEAASVGAFLVILLAILRKQLTWQGFVQALADTTRIIIFVYLFGGCFMDAMAMIMLTIPIFFPVATTLGFDPIWFGVVIVLISEMGVVTPPVGVNVYVVFGVAKDVPLEEIFKGVLPMVIALLICNLVILFFPQIALFLPSLMR